MMKTSGYRVSPTEVEEVLYATRLVGECVAFGVDHPTLGQAIQVIASAPDGSAALDVARCWRSAAQHMPAYMVPHGIEPMRRPAAAQPQRQDRPQAAGHGAGSSGTEAPECQHEPSPSQAPMPRCSSLPCARRTAVVGGMPLSRSPRRSARRRSTPTTARCCARARGRAARGAAAAVKLHYAMKANPMPALVRLMAGLVDGIDVASAGELKVALDAGADPAEVSFAGPGKRDGELRQAVAAGVLVNVESMRELPVLAAASQALGLPARVAVRVNPDFELKGSGMKMGGGPKQFGVDVEQVPERAAPIGGGAGLPSRASTSLPARRTCAPSRSARRSRRATSWRCAWPRMRRRRCASSTWAAASASRTSRASSGSTWRPSAPTWRRWSSVRRARCPARSSSSSSAATSSARPACT
jgi:hypothetical protein